MGTSSSAGDAAGANHALLGGGVLEGGSPAASQVAILAASAEGAVPRPLLSSRSRHALVRGRLSQRELERAVAALQRCLGQLTTSQRRVLILRAGLGPRRALSREQVARRLDLGRGQVRRIERRGLRRLGALDGAGRCVAGNGVAAAGLLGSGSFGGTVGTLAAAVEGSAGLAQPGSGVKGVFGSGGGEGPSLGDALPPPLGQGNDWTLSLILLTAAAMVALLVRRELRRQRER